MIYGTIINDMLIMRTYTMIKIRNLFQQGWRYK